MGEVNLCKYNKYNKEFLVKVSFSKVIIDSEVFQFLKFIPTPPLDHANQTFPPKLRCHTYCKMLIFSCRP